MIKTIIKLAIAALVVHACWRSGNVVLKYSKFKDAVHEMVLFSNAKSDGQLAGRVMDLARQYEVPLAEENVQIQRVENRTIVNAVYTDQIEFIPTKFYPWQFKVNVDAVNVYLPSTNDIHAPGR
jgi:type III secretion system FlhB-like substrate exporter